MNRDWRGFRGVDSSIKPIAEAGSTSLFQNSMPSAHYLRFPDLLFYIIHILFSHPPSPLIHVFTGLTSWQSHENLLC